MSPLLKSVVQAGHKGALSKCNPHQVFPEDFFTDSEKLRTLFARLVDAPQADHMAIIPAVSYGIAIVARNIKMSRGQNVVVVEEQFPSNIYTWKRLVEEKHGELRTVNAPNSSETKGKEWNEALLEAIDNRTCVVAMPHVHWTDGTLFDLVAVRKRTSEVGALLIIDGTQSVGALPFSISEIQPDALICAGYKWLMGPYSIGLAYLGEYFHNGVPLEENWINRLNSERFGGLVNYQEHYQPGALRYEVGEHSNFILVPMLIAALEQLLAWGTENIQQYCRELTEDVLSGLTQHGFQLEGPEWRSHHLFGVRLPEGYDSAALSGRFQQRGVSVSNRGTAIRVSPHLYNEPQDLEVLQSCFLDGL